MQKILIILGIAILIAGIAWPILGKLPLGKLPGDIIINRPGLKVYMPITTMILVSIVISVIFGFSGNNFCSFPLSDCDDIAPLCFPGQHHFGQALHIRHCNSAGNYPLQMPGSHVTGQPIPHLTP